MNKLTDIRCKKLLKVQVVVHFDNATFQLVLKLSDNKWQYIQVL